MAKQKARSSARYGAIVAVLLTAALFAASYFATVVAISQKTYDIAVGDVAPETVRATDDVEDTSATEKLRDLARRSVPSVYMIDSARAEELCGAAKAFFDALDAAVLSATESKLLANVTEEYPSADKWRTILSPESIAALRGLCTPELTEDELFAVLSSPAVQVQFMRETVLTRLDSLLLNGLAESGLESVHAAVESELLSGLIATGLKPLAVRAALYFAQPTYVVDETATIAAQSEAAAATPPVIIEKGDVLVSEGAVVTASQYSMMTALGLIKTRSASVLLYVGIGLYLLTAFALFFVWMLLSRQVFITPKSMLMITVFSLAAIALNMLCLKVSPAFGASLLAVMLVYLLVGESPALSVSLLIAAVAAIMASGRTGVMGFNSVAAGVSALSSGLSTCFALRHANRRSSMITAGLVGGGAAALAVTSLFALAGRPLIDILIAVGWAIGGNVIAAVLCVGTLSIWETLFDVATPARLSELTNANHPLLKRLMNEAPGTYHHSVMAASLAEGAAESIGANALLARVGAYYHDVGKLRRPLYFLENQSGENIHDTLPPEESAAIIIAHQKDGAALLTKHKLPSQVVRIAAEHHGSALVSYFYHKACEASGDAPDQAQFRYPGQRPSTKEGALVMMADCCEAAVRSLGETTMDRIEAMVHKLIWDMVASGQIASAPLTLVELRTVERSFLKTFVSLSHDRIEYPENDVGGDGNA